jgi:type VI secretion system VasD/TssJ family lipoprotein
MTQLGLAKGVLLPVLLLFVASCAPQAVDPVPVNKTLTVSAGSNVNRYSDAAHPVVIRLYQLSSRTEFEAAGFWDIFNSSESLAGVVVDKRSLSPLYPDEKRLVAIDLEKDTFFLGAFAEFADYARQTYSAVIPINAAILDAGVTVTVTSSGVAIQNRLEETGADAAPVRRRGLFGALRGASGDNS